MEEVWTVKAALDWTQGYLERKGDENPRLSAEWLLSKACGLSRIQLYMGLDRPLSQDERTLLREYVTRRGRGEPLQYVVGEAPFRYLTLKIRPGVLIPRPETEVLVSEALACLPQAPKRTAAWNEESDRLEREALAAYKERLTEAESAFEKEAAEGDESDASEVSDATVHLVADICTGSGCIACAVATERPDTRVIAVDLSPEAVALARENVQGCGVSDTVKVLEGDLGAPIPDRYLGRFSLVLSNPPYIPSAVLESMPCEVTAFEPSLALDGGPDGLHLFRRLLPWALKALKPGGSFLCELHEECLEQARGEALAYGFTETRIADDLAGRPRVLAARKAL